MWTTSAGSRAQHHKLLIIINQSTIRDHLTPVRTAMIKKTRNNKHWWNVKQYGDSSNQDTMPLVPLLVSTWRKQKHCNTISKWDLHAPTPFTQRSWQSSRYGSNLSVHQRMNGPRGRGVQTQTHAVEYYTATKKNGILPYAMTQRDPASIRPSEVRQRDEARYCMIPLICGIWKKKIAVLKQSHRYRSVVAPGGEGERNGGPCARTGGVWSLVAITQ